MDNEKLPAAAAAVKKKPRTSEDFYLFCTYILDYVNYEGLMQEDLRKKSTSPTDSVGVISDSNLSSGQEDKPIDLENSSEFNNYVSAESYEMVTCYCNKPFAGRAMIECSNCLTWIHLSCAKIRKKYIPEVFYCIKCTHKFQNGKDIKETTLHSQASSSCSSSNASTATIKSSQHFKNIERTNSRYREYDGNGAIRFTPSSSNSPTNPVYNPKISNPLFFHPYHHSVPVKEQINHEYLRRRVERKSEDNIPVDYWYGDSEKIKFTRDRFYFKKFGRK